MDQKLNNRKEIFSELRDLMYEQILQKNEVRISLLKNNQIIEEIKTLQVIELDDLESFYLYTNYDHFIMFKFKDDFYFCDTELTSPLGKNSLIKISDFNQHLRLDKMKKLEKLN